MGYWYNNVLFGVAEYVVYHLEGRSFEEVTKELILDPLGMDDTRFVHLSREKWGQYATGYQISNNVPREVSVQHIS